MKRERASDDISRKKLGTTELMAAISGLGVAAVTLWLQVREKFYKALKRTGVYDKAIEKSAKVKKALNTEMPNFSCDEFDKVLDESRKALKNDLKEIHTKLGMYGFSYNTLKRRMGRLTTTDKLELTEKVLGNSFMAATLVVGCGVLLEMSKNQRLKTQVEEKELKALDRT